MYLPDGEDEQHEIQEELDRERKRYGLSEGYNWEQRVKDAEGGMSYRTGRQCE